MRVKFFLAAVVLAAACAQAQDFSTLRAPDTERFVTTYGGPQSRLAMWIYTDRYVYQPSQAITLRWTIKANDDLYPYVVVAYQQNNQTGTKSYLPGNTATVTDINGSTLAQGFQPGQLTSIAKAVPSFAQGITAPNEPGMHTIVVELRDYTGTRVLKASYMKIGVVNSIQVLSGDVTADRTLTNDTQWNLTGRVNVKDGATLTIEPGTFIIGQPGSQPPSVLVITRTGKINASGTRSRPIIMTSSLPFGQRTRGDWGGLIMLGAAAVNVAGGTSFIEGLTADTDLQYGGGATPDDTHSCGTLRYVRVEYAGSILAPNSEVNSITWGACGSNTVADHLQTIYGLDDAFEWFGGTVNAKYLVGGLANDDFVDFQLGYRGKIQYGIMYQSPDAKGNRGLEGDNSEFDNAAVPFSNPTIFNVTFIGSGTPGSDEGDNVPGIFLRRGARATINNTVVTRFWAPGVSISDANTQAQADLGNVRMDGILLFNNNIAQQGASTLDGQLRLGYTLDFANGQKGNGAGRNFLVADPLLGNPFEYSAPDFQARFGSPIFRAGWVSPPDDGFFDQSAKFLGAFGDVDWTEEWTNFLIEPDIAP